MMKTITIKIRDKSENVERIIRNLIRLYEDEVDSLSIIHERHKK